MDSFDKRIKNLTDEQNVSMPADMAKRFDDTLAEIRKKETRKPSGFNVSHVLRYAAVLLIGVFVAAPNLNADVAYAMKQIPVIGPIVDVITVAEYKAGNNSYNIEMEIPEIVNAGAASRSIEVINVDIVEFTDECKAYYEEIADEFPDLQFNVDVGYEILTDSEDWLTLQLIMEEIAASGNTSSKIYNINKNSGELAQLSGIFDDKFDYVSVLSENVKEQMEAQMAEDDDLIYWIYPNDNTYWGFYEIDENQSFYFNQENQLVLVFDEYQVAPGYMGRPEFVIPEELYEGCLNAE